MFNRREFCKSLLGLGAILSLPKEVIAVSDLICRELYIQTQAAVRILHGRIRFSLCPGMHG